MGIVSGQLKYKLDRVAPGANSSQTVVVRAKKFGYFNFTAAEVSYSGEGGSVVLTGLSSDPGQGVIIAARDYDRQFSAHLLDWAAFAVMTFPSCCGGPASPSTRESQQRKIKNQSERFSENEP